MPYRVKDVIIESTLAFVHILMDYGVHGWFAHYHKLIIIKKNRCEMCKRKERRFSYGGKTQ